MGPATVDKQAMGSQAMATPCGIPVMGDSTGRDLSLGLSLTSNRETFNTAKQTDQKVEILVL